MRYQRWADQHLTIVSQNSDEANCLCPLPDHLERNPSFRFNTHNGLWICHGCSSKGNVQQLAQKLHVGVIDSGISSDVLRRRLETRKAVPRGSAQEPQARYTESFLDRFESHHHYWYNRGFSEDIIETFQLGYDSNSNRCTIPLRTSYGGLLGVIYRRLDEQRPKYLSPFDFRRSNNLFGAWLVRETALKAVAIVEGPADAIACWDADIPALAIYGSTFAYGQLEILKSLNVSHVVTMTDNDEAGRKAASNIQKMLHGHGIFSHEGIYKKRAKDPAELELHERYSMFKRALTSRNT